jgi:hypothetical protein
MRIAACATRVRIIELVVDPASARDLVVVSPRESLLSRTTGLAFENARGADVRARTGRGRDVVIELLRRLEPDSFSEPFPFVAELAMDEDAVRRLLGRAAAWPTGRSVRPVDAWRQLLRPVDLGVVGCGGATDQHLAPDRILKGLGGDPPVSERLHYVLSRAG